MVITSGRPTQDLQARQAHNSSASRTLSSFQNRLGPDEQMEGLAIRRGSKGPATGASDREGRPLMHTAGGGPSVASGARMIDAAPVGGWRVGSSSFAGDLGRRTMDRELPVESPSGRVQICRDGEPRAQARGSWWRLRI